MRISLFGRLVIVVGILGFLGWGPGLGRTGASAPSPDRGAATPTFIAHRGYSDRYPENTIGSILEAVDHGAEWVEVDVRWTRDGQPVLHHDAGLKESLDFDHGVGDVTLAEIQARPIVGSVEKIPTLEQAMKAMAGDRSKLYLHLKDGELDADQARRLVALCRDNGFLRRVRFNSGSFAVLARLRAENPKVWLEFDLYDAKGLLRSNLLTGQDLLSIARLAVRSVGTFSFKIDGDLVSQAHLHGLLVDALVSVPSMPFHKESVAYLDMLRLGVDEIMTDEIGRYPLPQKARAERRTSGRQTSSVHNALTRPS